MSKEIKSIGTSLEILAPYLPYGIDLEWKGWNGKDDFLPCRAKLHGLSEQHARVRYNSLALPFADCTPVLRPFSALCDPLPNGTVPAVEVAKIQWPYYKITKAEFQLDGQLHIWAKTQDDDGDEYEYRFIYLSEKDFLDNSFGYLAVRYLLIHHFAVGLEPHQFIEKK